MSHIIEFDDWEDAQRKMAEAERRANESICPKQREVVWGSHWIRAAADGMLEYGVVLTEEEATKGLGRNGIAELHERYERGYRFSWAHSVMGDGLGDTHLAVMWPITQEEFEQAKAQRWELNYAEWQTEMLARVTSEMREAKLAASNDTPPETGSPQEGS